MSQLPGNNYQNMRTFAEAYPDFVIVQDGLAQIGSNAQNEFVQPVVAQIPWTLQMI